MLTTITWEKHNFYILAKHFKAIHILFKWDLFESKEDSKMPSVFLPDTNKVMFLVDHSLYKMVLQRNNLCNMYSLNKTKSVYLL